MQYCEVKDKGISIVLPESVKRLEETIVESSLREGAFGADRGTSVDEEAENHQRMTVYFPKQTKDEVVKTFAEKVDAAIIALIELSGGPK